VCDPKPPRFARGWIRGEIISASAVNITLKAQAAFFPEVPVETNPLVALAALSMMAGCGSSPVVLLEDPAHQDQAVVGGSPVAGPNVGATVALMDPAYGEFFCSGTLVSPRVVITAAHCLYFNGLLSNHEVTVVANHLQPDLAPESLQIPVDALAVHPGFSEFPGATDDPDGLGDEPDLGLLILSQSITTVAPAPILSLAEFDAGVMPGNPLVIAGFGVTDTASWFSSAGTLYEAQTPFVRGNPTEFVAGNESSPDSCSGDSGGPAYWVSGGERFLVGATSRGVASSDLECGGGGIYTLVSSHVEWVENNSDGHYTAPAPEESPPPGGGVGNGDNEADHFPGDEPGRESSPDTGDGEVEGAGEGEGEGDFIDEENLPGAASPEGPEPDTHAGEDAGDAVPTQAQQRKRRPVSPSSCSSTDASQDELWAWALIGGGALLFRRRVFLR
jgi:MYXO-CTERM domain-containing protein